MLTAALAGGLVFGCGERPGEREFQNALRQMERDRYIRARDLFEKSINKRPGHEVNAFSYQYLGYIAWSLGDPGTATAYFENSRRLNPRLFEPVFSLGALAFDAGEFTRARELFVQAAELNPDDPRPHEYLARIAWAGQDPREARRALFEALRRAPRSPRVLTALAIVEFEDSGPAGAVSHLMQALEKDSTYAPALYNLGRVHAAWPGQTHQAEAFFRQYLELAAEGPMRDKARDVLARLRDGAVPLRDVSRDPAPPRVDERPEPRPRTLDDFLRDATRLVQEGRRDQAVGLCLRAAALARQERRLDDEARALTHAKSLDPDHPSVHLALGRHHAAREDHKQARAAFARTVELAPDWSQALIGLADSATALGDYDVASDALSRAVELEANDPSPLWTLARLYEHTGAHRRAEAAFRRFQARFPDDPRAVTAAERIDELQLPASPPERVSPSAPPADPAPSPEPTRNVQAAVEAFNRGAAYQQRRDWGNALFFYARAIENDPNFERAHYNVGMIHLERRDFDAARRSFGRAVALAPDKVTALYNLAFAHHELGQTDRALTRLHEAVDRDLEFAPAHLLLGIIYSRDPDRHDRARQHYARFLALRPNDPAADSVRSWLRTQR